MAEETKIIRIIVDSSKAIDGSAAATRALEKLERSAAGISPSLDRMEQALGRVGGYLKAQLGLMVAELGARFIQMGKDSLAAVAGLDELAEQMGITTRGLQALQFSAAQNGVKLEQLETGLSKFSQKIGEASEGSKEMLESLNGLSVKILDFQGKLRPTDAIMTDVARAIVGIDDPARRAAAAVDFFGKAGTRLLPVLNDIAKGSDSMAAAAERAGAIIEDRAIKRLDAFGDASERTRQKARVSFATMAADALEFADKAGQAMKQLDEAERARTNTAGQSLIATLNGKVDGFAESAARGAAMFVEAFRALPEQLGKLFTDGMNAAIESVERGLNAINRAIVEKAPWMSRQVGITGEGISIPRLNGGGASLGDYSGRISAAGNAAAERMRALRTQEKAAAAAYLSANRQATMWDDEEAARRGTLAPVNAGFTNPAIKGAGQSEADRIGKLMRDTAREVDAANAYAEASERGARAVSDLEIHFKALKAAQDAYGNTADKNAGQVATLTKRIEEQMQAAERAKALKDFNLGTADLERANELLAAENALINASAEDRAREIALIRLKHDVQSRGLDDTNPKEKEAIDRRREAITQNERLKAQAEELKKANELWTEPLKSALQSIQSTAADMWERILENGKFSMQEFGQLFIKTARRAAAELLALATIRPVIGMGVQALGSIGLVSPQTATSLGYGGGSAGGGLSLPSFGGGSGWLSNSLGSFGQWLNTPMTGPYAGISAAGMRGVPQLTPSLMNPSTWGITPMQGIGAIAGIGSGIYQLASGNGSTASTIGGIGSMIGGAVSLIPGVGQIAGPIISILSSVLPSLFGGEDYKWPPLLGANMRMEFDPATGRYTNTGSQMNGGQSITGKYSGAGIEALWAAAGGTPVPGKVWGNAVWQNYREGTTATYVLDPQGRSMGHHDGGGDAGPWVDQAQAFAFRQTAINGGLAGISGNLINALANHVPASLAEAGQMVEFVKGYDKLGAAAKSAKDALEAINAQFASMTSTATTYGLSLAPIQEEQAKQRKRYAQDFIDAMLDPMAVQMRALDDQRKDSLASAEYIRDNVKDVYVDMAKITEYWTKKETDLRESFYEKSTMAAEAAVNSLQALIRRLTYGDLANASPELSLTGTRANYGATLAQARAGSSTAINGLAGSAEAYANSARSYFASSAEYTAIVEQIRRDLEAQVGVLGGGGGSGTAANNNDATNAVLQSNAELRGMVGALLGELSSVKDQLAAATAEMKRRA